MVGILGEDILGYVIFDAVVRALGNPRTADGPRKEF